LCHALEKSAEKREMLEGYIISLKAKIEQLENSKDSTNQSFQTLRLELEEERRNHASFINHLESVFVREKLKRTTSSHEIK
jgi:prefoldin subunit 5